MRSVTVDFLIIDEGDRSRITRTNESSWNQSGMSMNKRSESGLNVDTKKKSNEGEFEEFEESVNGERRERVVRSW